MINQQQMHSKMYSTYYPKILKNTINVKGREKSLALVTSKIVFDRFVNYATENTRQTLAAQREVEKLMKLKKATYEMSKNWDNTVENIKKQRKEELLSRRKKEELEREQFTKDMATRKEAERLEIIEQAKHLLFSKKPECKLINGALLTSECIRELNAQRAFQKALENINKKKDLEYANNIQKDVEKYKEEQRKKAEEELRKRQNYGQQLKKQIEEIKKNAETLAKAEKFAEQEELKNMARELELLQQNERKQIEDRKMELKKLFTDAIKEKKLFEEQRQKDETIQERARQVFARSKNRVQQMLKTKMKEERDEYIRRLDDIANKCVVIKSNDAEENERIIREEKEIEDAELERNNVRKEYEEKIKLDIEKYQQEEAAARKKREEEEKNVKSWEILQRIKRSEFDKKMKIEQLENEAKKKQEYAQELRKQMVNKEVEYKRIVDDSTEMQATIDNRNRRILKYGKEVLKESEGVRPLFPIIKAVEQLKKDMGLTPPKKYEESIPPVLKKRRRRPVCTKTLQESQILYLG